MNVSPNLVKSVGIANTALWGVSKQNKVTNITLAILQAAQLVAELSRERTWKQFGMLTLTLAAIALNIRSRMIPLPISTLLKKVALFAFPMIQSYFEIHEAICALNASRFSQGFLGLSQVVLRVQQAGSVLADTQPKKILTKYVNKDYSRKAFKGEIIKNEYYLNCCFDNSRLIDMMFYGVTFKDTSFIGVVGQKVLFLGCIFDTCDFSKAKLSGDLKGCRFKNCQWQSTNLQKTHQEDCQFQM